MFSLLRSQSIFFFRIHAYSTIPFFNHPYQQKAISQIVERCLSIPPYQKLLSVDDERVFHKIQKDNFQTLRVYSRLLNKVGNIERDFFVTFKTQNAPTCIQSPLLNTLIDTKSSKIVYGLGFNKAGIKKIWIAPYGHQPEFINSLSADYIPFITLSGNHGKPHYIGYFPEFKHHQVYYFLGNESQNLDPRLAHLNPDYYGFSRTYDSDWNPIKENHYAIRVPSMFFKNAENFDLPIVKYLNISYRKNPNNLSEIALSYLLGSFK